MASVLVDPDDLSYMDEVDDKEVNSTESREPGKRFKRKKNQPIKEEITVNSGTILVKELREDRRERLESEKNERELNAEAGGNIDKTGEDVEMEHLDIVRELREERRHAQQLQLVRKQKKFETSKIEIGETNEHLQNENATGLQNLESEKSKCEGERKQNENIIKKTCSEHEGEYVDPTKKQLAKIDQHLDRRQAQNEIESERRQKNTDMIEEEEDEFNIDTDDQKLIIQHCAEIHVTNDEIESAFTQVDSKSLLNQRTERDLELLICALKENDDVENKLEEDMENKQNNNYDDKNTKIGIMQENEYEQFKTGVSDSDSDFEKGALNECENQTVPEPSHEMIQINSNTNSIKNKNQTMESLCSVDENSPTEKVKSCSLETPFGQCITTKPFKTKDSGTSKDLKYINEIKENDSKNNKTKPKPSNNFDEIQHMAQRNKTIGLSEERESVDKTEVLLDETDFAMVKYKHKKPPNTNIGKGRKETANSKHKSKMPNGDAVQNESTDIKIIITGEDGIPHEARYDNKRRKCEDRRAYSESTLDRIPDIESSEGDSIMTLNYMRKISKEPSENNLIKQQEMYLKSKAKPFKDLDRVKSGVFDVGIEGDSKRSSNIKAITIMPDKRMLMFDRNNKCLKLFDKDFNPLDKISVNSKFCGLAAIFDETIAATFPDTKKLQLYHIDKYTNQICRERTHDIEEEFYSVAHYKNKLYLLQRNPVSGLTKADEWKIRKLNLNKNDIKDVRTFSPGHKDCALLVNHDGIYMTNKLENEILLIGHDGAVKSRCKTELSLPGGITADKAGNIFVCGGSVTSFIEIFKPNLKGSKLIYKKTSNDLVAMCFDKDADTLFVCDKILGKIMKIRIEYKGVVQGLMKSFVMGGGNSV